jgi:hypothetical protein
MVFAIKFTSYDPCMKVETSGGTGMIHTILITTFPQRKNRWRHVNRRFVEITVSFGCGANKRDTLAHDDGGVRPRLLDQPFGGKLQGHFHSVVTHRFSTSARLSVALPAELLLPFTAFADN